MPRLTEAAAESRLGGERRQAGRLVAEEPNRLPAYTTEMDVLQNLKRIYYFAKRMAKTVTPEVVVQKNAEDWAAA